MPVSMRVSLHKIGEPKAGKTIPAFRSGFHSAPASLWAALRATNSPQIESWINTYTSEFENKTWTEECQGLTSDGQFWYVSSNNKNFRAVHKFTLDFKQSPGAVMLPLEAGKHIGDIDYYEGRIYVPVDDPTSKVWVIDHNLNTLRVADLGGKVKFFMGWCALNPWNGYLYSSAGDNVDRVHAYDPNNNFAYKGFLALEGPLSMGYKAAAFRLMATFT